MVKKDGKGGGIEAWINTSALLVLVLHDIDLHHHSLDSPRLLEHPLELALFVQRRRLLPSADELSLDEDAGDAPAAGQLAHVVLERHLN